MVISGACDILFTPLIAWERRYLTGTQGVSGHEARNIPEAVYGVLAYSSSALAKYARLEAISHKEIAEFSSLSR